MRKVVFLDRDGVINIERGEYTYKPEDFELLPDLIPFLKELKKVGFEFIMISNQGGVAKGLYALEDVDLLHNQLGKTLNDQELDILDIFYSPHHTEIGASLDRKPDSLMLERAIYRHEVDVNESFFIGDSERDIFAAEKVGLRGIKMDANAPLLPLLENL